MAGADKAFLSSSKNHSAAAPAMARFPIARMKAWPQRRLQRGAMCIVTGFRGIGEMMEKVSEHKTLLGHSICSREKLGHGRVGEVEEKKGVVAHPKKCTIMQR
jgi:hypothetical protein